MSVRIISRQVIEQLCAESRASPRLRQHLNLHADHAEPVQRMLNAVQMDSYIRPHRHSLNPKTETMFVVAGQFMLFVFDDAGAILEKVLMGSGRAAQPDISSGVELPPGTWHTVIAMEPDSVLLEIKAGPFDPHAAGEYAPWSPADGSAESRIHLAKLRELVNA